eukprot:6020303-Ditylum_brightwellii.AAC.1
MNSGGVLGGGRFPSGGMMCGLEGWARFFVQPEHPRIWRWVVTCDWWFHPRSAQGGAVLAVVPLQLVVAV